jgi:hypothetical protein
MLSLVIRKRCLTSMRTRIVFGFRLARRNEIVSLPPEKMRSTATADPMARIEGERNK